MRRDSQEKMGEAEKTVKCKDEMSQEKQKSTGLDQSEQKGTD